MTTPAPSLHSYGTFLNEKAHATLHRRLRHRRHHPTTTPDLTQWMSLLPSHLPLSSLTLPGTHDSAAYATPFPFIATQNLPLETQLLSGIRYFDFRLGLRSNVLEMVHGRALLPRTFASCLAMLHAFLTSHPSEALVVQIKQDRAPESSDVSFPDAVWAALTPDADKWRFDPTTPSLGECRGKIQLLRRFAVARGGPYRGIDVSGWEDNPARPFTIRTWRGVELVVQDHYNPSEPLALPEFVERKAGDVVGLLELARRDEDPARWYLNFVSGYEFNLYFQASPHDVAVGGWWYYRFVEGVNRRVGEWLREHKGRQRLGIVVMDYPEKPDGGLVAALVATNFERREKMRGRYW
ncbi:PLC-like phosphodiesterase [Elsinoe ampelina]|uniref:PLC-like phosphodiesterase n=1 Tax=Elsinoe ampelina TaxID=302913 RepID=A0A6A6G5B2_9PEZI|nr:PLC-like phosphodiesterase [Elsinoe ampelina]